MFWSWFANIIHNEVLIHLVPKVLEPNSITKPKLRYKAVIDYSYTEPPTYKITSQFPKWCDAMDAKFQALQKQETWSLVPPPPNVNLVGFKWVFKLKFHPTKP